MNDKEITSGVPAEPATTTLTEAIETSRESPVPAAENSKSSKTQEKKTHRKRKRRRKGVKIGDALRCEGLDERDVAQKLREVIERHTSNGKPDAASDKLLAEMLMNCFRYLDEAPPRTAAKPAGKVPARLLHDIPRPQRAARGKK
jgi:hypothetical protein